VQALVTLPCEERAAHFKALAQRNQLGEGVGLVFTNGLCEDLDFVRSLEAEEAEFCRDDVEDTGATSAGGRCGWFSTPASLFRQKDFAHYAGTAGNHTMVLLHPSNLQRMLLLYPAGSNNRPDQALPKSAQQFDGAGQARVHQIYPGRAGISFSNPDNVRLQRTKGPSFTHNLRKAHCALHSLLIMGALGLEKCSEADQLLDGAVARTIEYTHALFSRHQSVQSAMEAMACLKGAYVNRWPASFHMDADKYMETWSIRQVQPAARTPVPTLVPQLRLDLTADANATVWTASLSCLMHAALDLGGSITEAAGRGANDAFHLQSRGASNIPLWI
jgi:hypothetical protein